MSCFLNLKIVTGNEDMVCCEPAPFSGWVIIFTPGGTKLHQMTVRWQQRTSHRHRLVRELGEHCAYKGDGGWAPLMDNSPNNKRIYITYGDINLLYSKGPIVYKGCFIQHGK